MAEEQLGGVEPIYPELADWILSFSAGATPEAVAELVRSALRDS